MMLHAIKEKIM